MGKIFILFAVGAFLVACEKSKSTTADQAKRVHLENQTEDEARRVADSVINAIDYAADVDTYGENPKVKEAKQLIDESTLWMEKGIRKEISVEESNKHINSIMEKFQKLNSSLSGPEQQHVKQYRIEKAQKAIDLQIQYSE